MYTPLNENHAALVNIALGLSLLREALTAQEAGDMDAYNLARDQMYTLLGWRANDFDKIAQDAARLAHWASDWATAAQNAHDYLIKKAEADAAAAVAEAEAIVSNKI